MNQIGGANRKPTQEELFMKGKSSNKKIYYGVARPLTKAERRPTQSEAIRTGNVSYYGLFQISPIALIRGMHATKKESKADIIRNLSKARGKKSALNKKLKDTQLSAQEKAKLNKELELVNKEVTNWGNKIQQIYNEEDGIKAQKKEGLSTEEVHKFMKMVNSLEPNDYKSLIDSYGLEAEQQKLLDDILNSKLNKLEAEGKKLTSRKINKPMKSEEQIQIENKLKSEREHLSIYEEKMRKIMEMPYKTKKDKYFKDINIQDMNRNIEKSKRYIAKLEEQLQNLNQTGKGLLTDLVPAKYPTPVKAFIDSHKDWLITRITLARKPVEQGSYKLLNLISLGKLKRNQDALNYDMLYHLSLELELTNGPNKEYIRIELNHVIQLNKLNQLGAGISESFDKVIKLAKQKLQVVIQKASETDPKILTYLKVPIKKPIPFFEFLEKGRKRAGDERFFKYHAIDFNCQAFVNNLLIANGLMTDTIRKFVSQDAQKLLKGSEWFKPVMVGVTDITALLDWFIYN